ncbi:hypothetical protein [Rhodopseudomonas parapalustris]
MKFYEFKQFEYYSLIGADTKEEAIKYYEENVANIEEEDGEPEEITRDEALKKLLNICNEDEKAEAMEEFELYTKDSEPYWIIIDPSLL